jgi:glutamate carboxypeptidase
MTPLTQPRVQRFLNDLETLTNLDSGSDNPAGITRVATFLRDRLRALGFEARILELGDSKTPCLEATRRPKGDPGRDRPFDLMLLGHMDTVFPPGEARRRPFAIHGDRAMGPGVCDMKGGLLVALHALEALREDGGLDSLNLLVTCNGDEETGSKASREWIAAGAARSLRVLVFEPCRPGFRCVLRRKGGGWFTVTARGRAAHAGADPEKGANAIVELAHQVLAIGRLNNEGTGTSAQVTVISGGDKTNIIPDTASASVDVRIAARSEKERVEAFFQSLARNTHVPGVTVSVSGRIDRPPLEPDAAAMELWGLVQETGVQLGIPLSWIATGGCSDGNFTSAQGVPTVDGMGIVGAEAHTPDEYVELASIEPMIDLVAGVCRKLAGSPAGSGVSSGPSMDCP